MLSCHELAHKASSDYIDGHLNWREQLAVRLHLFLCVNCRRFIRQLRLVKSTLLRRADVVSDPLPTSQSDDEQKVEDSIRSLARQLLSEYQRQAK